MKRAASSPLKRLAISMASSMTMAGARMFDGSIISKTAIRRMLRSMGVIRAMRQLAEDLRRIPSTSSRRPTIPRTSRSV